MTAVKRRFATNQRMDVLSPSSNGVIAAARLHHNRDHEAMIGYGTAMTSGKADL
jgi:hypothetical protein